MKLNNRQQSLLNIHITKAVIEGNSENASGRKLKAGEFKPCLAEGDSGAIWQKSGLPQELNVKFVFMPVVTHESKELLGVFIGGKGFISIPLALINPEDTAELINDLMVSAAQYSDGTILAEVSKRVQDVVLAFDLPIKKQLLKNSQEALALATHELVEKRAEAKTKHFEATIDAIKARAELKMAKAFASTLVELTTIALIADDQERKTRADSIVPDVKRILEKVSKNE